MKPTKTVESNRPKKKKEKTTKCGNCGMIGHDKTEYVEAITTVVSKTRQKTKLRIKNIF